MTTERPTASDPEIIRQVVNLLLPDFMVWCEDHGHPEEEAAKVLTRVLGDGGELDGFRLATELTYWGYGADAQLVSILDEARAYTASLLIEAEARWAAVKNLTGPKIGTYVRYLVGCRETGLVVANRSNSQSVVAYEVDGGSRIGIRLMLRNWELLEEVAGE